MLRPARRWTLAIGSALVLSVATPTLTTANAVAPSTDSGAPAAAQAAAATDFSGTVALSNCSGAIVRWASSAPNDTAMMLTNGHCVDFMDTREVIVDEPATRGVTLLTGAGDTAGTVQTTRIVYATMWKTDVALYELGVTYKQLSDQYGVPALTLASTKPSPKDQAISVISGYWLTEYKCNLNGFAYRLHEYVWTWRQSLRYSDGGCQVIGGTSGSPILDKDRVQIGINNTINEDGERCTLNNPCEENRKGKITVHPHRGYGQETWIFYTCLSGTELNLDKQGCRLGAPK
jgi:V8-like Glu-specific endopeptidase